MKKRGLIIAIALAAGGLGAVVVVDRAGNMSTAGSVANEPALEPVVTITDLPIEVPTAAAETETGALDSRENLRL